MPWLDVQKAFGDAVRRPDAPVPESVQVSNPAASLSRFNVYRNNHVVTLVDALASRFPVVQQLVGEAFFRAMAREYVALHPPRSPMIIAYGSDFATFVSMFAPARHLPFLGDVARLEFAMGEAYHAADASPVTIDALRGAGVTGGSVHLDLHPSLRRIESPWPVFSLWSAHQRTDGPVDLSRLDFSPEAGVVLRPEFNVQTLKLEPAAFQFVSLLSDGRGLHEAAEALEVESEAALADLLQFVFLAGMIVGVTTRDTTRR